MYEKERERESLNCIHLHLKDGIQSVSYLTTTTTRTQRPKEQKNLFAMQCLFVESKSIFKDIRLAVGFQIKITQMLSNEFLTVLRMCHFLFELTMITTLQLSSNIDKFALNKLGHVQQQDLFCGFRTKPIFSKISFIALTVLLSDWHL